MWLKFKENPPKEDGTYLVRVQYRGEIIESPCLKEWGEGSWDFSEFGPERMMYSVDSWADNVKEEKIGKYCR